MAILGQSFNRTELPQTESFDVIPEGQYPASVTGAELKTTNAGTGQYIKVEWTLSQDYAGRKVWQNLNIANPSAKAEEIGHQQLGQLMTAFGLEVVEDSDQLIGGSALIKLMIDKQVGRDDSNKITRVKPLSNAPAAPVQQQPQQAVPQAQPAQAAPPWKR